jgi:hypothetical protein
MSVKLSTAYAAAEERSSLRARAAASDVYRGA